jgi:hypothetical protein
MSRNRLIVTVLEKELAAGSGWSPGFFDRLTERDDGIDAAADEMLAGIRKGRRSKEPLDL